MSKRTNERETKDLFYFIWPQTELLQSSQFKSIPHKATWLPPKHITWCPGQNSFFALRCSQPDRVPWATTMPVPVGSICPNLPTVGLLPTPWARSPLTPRGMTQKVKWKVSKSQRTQSARLPRWKAAKATSHPVLSKWSWSETSLLPTPPPAHPQAAAWQV